MCSMQQQKMYKKHQEKEVIQRTKKFTAQNQIDKLQSTHTLLFNLLLRDVVEKLMADVNLSLSTKQIARHCQLNSLQKERKNKTHET